MIRPLCFTISAVVPGSGPGGLVHAFEVRVDLYELLPRLMKRAHKSTDGKANYRGVVEVVDRGRVMPRLVSVPARPKRLGSATRSAKGKGAKRAR